MNERRAWMRGFWVGGLVGAMATSGLGQDPPDILWQAYAGDGEARGLAFSPDGGILASGAFNRVRFWRASDGELIHDS